jgi:glycosyltransferase involved in cell wall biosynthesis
MKIIHIITGLTTGGAEMMLYKVLSEIDRERFTPIVVSLMDRGALGARIEALGIPLYTLGMKPGARPTPNMIWKLLQIVDEIKPDLIQGWMYHANLAAQIISILSLKFVPVIWNIRNCLSLSYEKPGTATVIKALIPLSIFPKKIIYNSLVSASQHEELGYKVTKTITIPNGFDPELFHPSIEARNSIRKELSLPSDCFLIGRFARYHPMKDYPNFIQAAAILLKDYPNVNFLLAGTDINGENQILCNLIQELGISERIHLLGERQDIPCLTAALDIASTSSSYGEAFANVIGEAMSCGVPCVVTDVGDSAWIVGDTGRVVPPRDTEALANAWKELILLGSEGREALGTLARARVIECFSLGSIVASYERLYESTISQKQITGV